jgi:hypothetical protein
MLHVDEMLVRGPVVVGAERDQVRVVVGPTLAARGNVVNVGSEVPTADDAAVIVALPNLLLDVLPLPTLPPTVTLCGQYDRVVLPSAKAVAITAPLGPAGVAAKGRAAMRAVDVDPLLPSSASGKALPRPIALVVAARNLYLRRELEERRQADWTRSLLLAAAKVAVMGAAVLMSVQVAVLPAGIPRSRNFLAATAGA